MIARQADSIALHVRENDTLTSQLRDVSAQLKDVRAELEEKARRLFIEGETHKSALETWKQEVSCRAELPIHPSGGHSSAISFTFTVAYLKCTSTLATLVHCTT